MIDDGASKEYRSRLGLCVSGTVVVKGKSSVTPACNSPTPLHLVVLE